MSHSMVVHIHRRWGMCSVHVHIHTAMARHFSLMMIVRHSEDDVHFQLTKVGEDK